MKKQISHISENKQKELQKIIKIIKETTFGNIWVELIILFWSYARWDYIEKDVVNDWPSTLEYKSDFDILAITRKPTQEKNIRLSILIWEKISQDKDIKTPVWLLVEDIYHVNNRIQENRYFYLDIKKEWIILYDSWKIKLKSGKKLWEIEKKVIQKQDFEMWFWMWEEFLIDYKNALKRWSYKIWVFYLHQATERYITSYMLVKTWYKPKTHDLKILYKKLCELNFLFENWFKKDEEKSFELLRKWYVDARYNRDYKINKDELLFLEKKVETIKKIVKTLCKRELNNL